VANTGFLALRLPSSLAEKAMRNIILHYICLTVYVGFIVMEATIIFFGNEVAAFFNQTLRFNHDAGKNIQLRIRIRIYAELHQSFDCNL
jgi:hypothetical protein